MAAGAGKSAECSASATSLKATARVGRARVLDPEGTLVGADAVDRALVELGSLAVAGLVDGKLDGGRTAVQNQYRQGRHEFNPLRLGLNESAELALLAALRAGWQFNRKNFRKPFL
jgi:hypothetical protein